MHKLTRVMLDSNVHDLVVANPATRDAINRAHQRRKGLNWSPHTFSVTNCPGRQPTSVMRCWLSTVRRMPFLEERARCGVSPSGTKLNSVSDDENLDQIDAMICPGIEARRGCFDCINGAGRG